MTPDVLLSMDPGRLAVVREVYSKALEFEGGLQEAQASCKSASEAAATARVILNDLKARAEREQRGDVR